MSEEPFRTEPFKEPFIAEPFAKEPFEEPSIREEPLPSDEVFPSPAKISTRFSRPKRWKHGNGESEAREASERLISLENALAHLIPSRPDGATLSEIVDRIDKQVTRVGKEQFKINALADAQQKNTEALLTQMRDGEAYRERELTQLRDRLADAGAEGRMDVVRRLLPALDGLEEALASGRRLLQRMANSAVPLPAPSLWQRLLPAPRAAPPAEPSSAQALSAWLEGLTFVQERLLQTLTSADVVPIRAEGIAFDPHLHVAVETIPPTEETPPGTIAREHRRGYVRGETVLRYAEVVVARALENS